MWSLSSASSSLNPTAPKLSDSLPELALITLKVRYQKEKITVGQRNYFNTMRIDRARTIDLDAPLSVLFLLHHD